MSSVGSSRWSRARSAGPGVAEACFGTASRAHTPRGRRHPPSPRPAANPVPPRGPSMVPANRETTGYMPMQTCTCGTPSRSGAASGTAWIDEPLVGGAAARTSLDAALHSGHRIHLDDRRSGPRRDLLARRLADCVSGVSVRPSAPVAVGHRNGGNHRTYADSRMFEGSGGPRRRAEWDDHRQEDTTRRSIIGRTVHRRWATGRTRRTSLRQRFPRRPSGIHSMRCAREFPQR